MATRIAKIGFPKSIIYFWGVRNGAARIAEIDFPKTICKELTSEVFLFVLQSSCPAEVWK